MSAHGTVEHVARSAYGKLLARLVRRSGDLARSEDALAEAFAAALRVWPEQGVPDAPEAWLSTVAKRKLVDGARHHAIADRVHQVLAKTEGAAMVDRDDRLDLLFACTHPAIGQAVRAPLMLQTVFGLHAGDIASAFLVEPTSMAKRLVRAKAKVRSAGIPFERPPRRSRRDRVSAVLEAIYAAFTVTWDAAAVEGAATRRFAVELAQLTADELPDVPEASALAALMLYADARSAARVVDGVWVPLREQDVARWDHVAIAEAERRLRHAATMPSLHRWGLEASIQSCHVAQRVRGVEVSAELVRLYSVLVQRFPTIGATLGWCAALSDNGEAAMALQVLDALDVPADHQPWHATRAAVLKSAGRLDEACRAYAEAARLAPSDAVRRWLLRQAG